MQSFGDMRPGRGKGKVRKTDECVEICRNQANRNKNENPCKWCVNAICRGFNMWQVKSRDGYCS